MEISKDTLKETIKTMTVNQKIEEVVDLLTNEMTDVQLQTVICCIMDPSYHTKTAALANPNRFTTKGALNPDKVEDVKLDKTI